MFNLYWNFWYEGSRFLNTRYVFQVRCQMNHDLQVTIIKELMSQLDEGRNVDAGVQYQMPTQSYVCPDIAEQEHKHFFMDHPQLIGLSGDLPAPGSFLTLDDFAVPILATRDKSGEFHAFLNPNIHNRLLIFPHHFF